MMDEASSPKCFDCSPVAAKSTDRAPVTGDTIAVFQADQVHGTSTLDSARDLSFGLFELRRDEDGFNAP